MPSLKEAMEHGDGEALASLLGSAKAEEKVEWVRSQLVGRGAELDTPFGRRGLVYADHTASGQSLRYIEDYILEHVLPFYGKSSVHSLIIISSLIRDVVSNTRACNKLRLIRDDGW
jgi:hypothetical protein